VNVYAIDLSPRFEYICILDVVYFSLSYFSYFIVCKSLKKKDKIFFYFAAMMMLRSAFFVEMFDTAESYYFLKVVSGFYLLYNK